MVGKECRLDGRMKMKVIKRDGKEVNFDPLKIRKAIAKAAASVGISDRRKLKELTDKVLDKLGKEIIQVEEIQDKIEETLVNLGEYKMAKAFILYRQKRTEVRRLAASLGVKDDLKLQTSSLIVLAKRYLLKDEKGKVKESPLKLYKRVAQSIARIDEQYKVPPKACKLLGRKFFDLMVNGYFLPNSPTLMNAGAPLGQLSACFVLPIEDSIDSIFQTLHATAKIHQTGGGTGFNFSNLRPSGDVVKTTGGVASGPVSFMRVYDSATQEIKQGGKRRGANMGILNVTHPNILDFITAKSRGGLENFNISVAVTDKFMHAVQKGELVSLTNPRGGEVVQNVPARAIWDLITAEAWKSGDPGLIFLDTINRSYSNVIPKLGPIGATNPCLSKDVWTLTGSGPFQIKDLIAKEQKLRISNQDWSNSGFFLTGEKETVEVTTKEGFSFRATIDHKLNVEGEKKKISELRKGDHLSINRNSSEWKGDLTEDEGYLLGLLLGDGSLTTVPVLYSWLADPGSEAIRLRSFEIAKSLIHRKDWKGWQRPDSNNRQQMKLIGLRRILKYLGLNSEKKITPGMERESSCFYKGLIRGLFDTDGSVQGSQKKGVSIRLSQSSLEFLKGIQRMLLRLGIFCTIYKRREEHTQLFDKKEYYCKKQYDLVITRADLKIFAEKIGFVHSKKKLKLETLLSSYKRCLNKGKEYATFEKLADPRTEEVYDVQVPGINQLEANGLVVSNCGEVPLYYFESCNLGSLNLSKFARINGKKKPEVDWEAFEKAIKLAVHFLDNVIDANKYPILEIEQISKRTRRIGLGVMGWADLLLILNLPYDSQEALDLAKTIMKFLTEKAREASMKLGEERGDFPDFKDSIWPKKGFKHMRNATVSCVAPTGSISILAGCSPGIEPLFSIVTIRNLEESLGTKLIDINSYFENRAIKDGFYSEELIEKVSRAFSLKEIKEIPEEIRRVFVTAQDIAPDWHVQMQAAFQTYTDNAVSKTVNLPNTATPHDVEQIYLLAWKLGCKGITVFRDGSKDKQVFITCRECEVD